MGSSGWVVGGEGQAAMKDSKTRRSSLFCVEALKKKKWPPIILSFLRAPSHPTGPRPQSRPTHSKVSGGPTSTCQQSTSTCRYWHRGAFVCVARLARFAGTPHSSLGSCARPSSCPLSSFQSHRAARRAPASNTMRRQVLLILVVLALACGPAGESTGSGRGNGRGKRGASLPMGPFVFSALSPSYHPRPIYFFSIQSPRAPSSRATPPRPPPPTSAPPSRPPSTRRSAVAAAAPAAAAAAAAGPSPRPRPRPRPLRLRR